VNDPAGTGFGEIDVIVGPAGSTATYTMPMVLWSEPSALTVTPFEGTIAGAVYNPAAVIVPFFVLPPTTPETDHVTLVLDNPVTAAEYCTVPFTPTVVYPGLIVTDWPSSAPEASTPAAHTNSANLLKFLGM
jgi:hypothetical protein